MEKDTPGGRHGKFGGHTRPHTRVAEYVRSIWRAEMTFLMVNTPVGGRRSWETTGEQVDTPLGGGDAAGSEDGKRSTHESHPISAEPLAPCGWEEDAQRRQRSTHKSQWISAVPRSLDIEVIIGGKQAYLQALRAQRKFGGFKVCAERNASRDCAPYGAWQSTSL
eukprot:6491010-Amphidinium_carterae.1